MTTTTNAQKAMTTPDTASDPNASADPDTPNGPNASADRNTTAPGGAPRSSAELIRAEETGLAHNYHPLDVVVARARGAADRRRRRHVPRLSRRILGYELRAPAPRAGPGGP